MTEPISFALVPSMSIDAILIRREALHAAITATQAAYLEMHARRRALFDGDSSGDETDYDLSLHWGRHGRRELDDADELAKVHKRIDATCWGHLLAKSGLEQMMDHQARTEWRKQLDDLEMPVFTRENINATFAALYASRGETFERGIENIFRKLSYSYKTNTPVKLGKRLIVTYAAERHTWRHNDKHPTKAGRAYTQVWGPTHAFADKLDDLVRAFCVLEGKPEPSHDRGAYATLARGEWMNDPIVETGETPTVRDMEFAGYVKFRGFKNGNVHLTFLRPDLVDQLNKIIAKRYPNALPPSREAE